MVVGGGYGVRVSTDAGRTFSTVAPKGGVYVDCSSDCSHIVSSALGCGSGQMYASNTTGASYYASNSSLTAGLNFRMSAVSADGQSMLAVTGTGSGGCNNGSVLVSATCHAAFPYRA